MNSDVVVSVADMKLSANPADKIVTHALGSCIGLTICDPVKGIGGLLHYMLPNPQERDSSKNPLMFASTGIPLLFAEFEKLGGSIKQAQLKAAGGAAIGKGNDYFKIGKKNILALRKLLWKYNLTLSGEDTGGDYYRTIHLILRSGVLLCRNHAMGEWEI